MFNKKTVFILGAGASYPYGYPLGTELYSWICSPDELYCPEKIKDKTLSFDEYENFLKWFQKKLNGRKFHFSEVPKGDKRSNRRVLIENHELKEDNGDPIIFRPISLSYFTEFQELRKKIKIANQTSVDVLLNYLKDETSIVNAGKFSIAYALMKAENKSFFLKSPPYDTIKNFSNIDKETRLNNRWYQYLLNDLCLGCISSEDDIFEGFKKSLENLNIITFNYTMDLEYFLIEQLSENISLSNHSKEISEHIFESIHHVYGQLYCSNGDLLEKYGALINGNKSDENRYTNFLRALECLDSKDRIRTIYEERNALVNKKRYLELLAEAKEIVIIGFGFDRENLSTLGFPEDLQEWRDFLRGKTIKYLDFGGKMNNLNSQFKKISEEPQSDIIVIRSTSISIPDAYQNDFKIFLF